MDGSCFCFAEVQALWDWWRQEGERNLSVLGGELGFAVVLFLQYCDVLFLYGFLVAIFYYCNTFCDWEVKTVTNISDLLFPFLEWLQYSSSVLVLLYLFWVISSSSSLSMCLCSFGIVFNECGNEVILRLSDLIWGYPICCCCLERSIAIYNNNTFGKLYEISSRLCAVDSSYIPSTSTSFALCSICISVWTVYSMFDFAFRVLNHGLGKSLSLVAFAKPWLSSFRSKTKHSIACYWF